MFASQHRVANQTRLAKHDQRATCVLGIDPGLTRCGFAVLRSVGAATPKIVSIGVITTKPTTPLPQRLAEINRELCGLFDEFSPNAVAVEQVFFQNNASTAMGVAQASGLALAIAAERGCDVVQYTPSQVKMAVAGSGNAEKIEVQKMVQKRLGLATMPKSPDAADAAALALCYIAMAPLQRSIKTALKVRKPA